MKVVLTGGAGFIGAHVARAYLSAGHQVAVIDDLSRGRADRLPEGVSLHRVDIRDREALAAALEFEQPEVVNHHAALVNVRESASRPAWYAEVNLEGTRNVVAAAVACGARKLIFASSGGAVYGEPRAIPIPEDHPLKPLSPYGRSKADAERAVEAGAGDLARVILRYGNVYGPGQEPRFGNGAVAIFADHLLDGGGIDLFGDGRQLRDYVYVDDVARANLLATELAVSGVFNIGSGKGRTLLELIDRLSAVLGREPQLHLQAPHTFEVWHNVLDTQRAEQVLGWQAQVGFDAGLQRTLESLSDESDPARERPHRFGTTSDDLPSEPAADA